MPGESDLEGYAPSEVAAEACAEEEEEELLVDDEGAVQDEPAGAQDAESSLIDRIVAEMQVGVDTEVLLFCAPLYSNKAQEVLGATQEFALWLRLYNLPLRRLHTDKSREFLTRQTRAWLLQHGILPTHSEPGDPKSNGTVEGAVKMVKSLARTLVAGSELPPAIWPLAATTACALQRAKQLNLEHTALAPLGTKVLAKEPRFHGEGSDIHSKWDEWSYGGLSLSTAGAHVLVKVEGERLRFLHTRNARVPEEPPEDIMPPAAAVASLEPSSSNWEAQALPLLHSWSPLKARSLVVKWALSQGSEEVKFGLYRHGGILGRLRATHEFPRLTQVLRRLLRHYEPNVAFTSIALSTGAKAAHVDSQNAPQSLNLVLPLKMPQRGGHHWVELRDGDVVKGGVEAFKDERGLCITGPYRDCKL